MATQVPITEIWDGTVCGPNAHGVFPTNDINPALQDWIKGVGFFWLGSIIRLHLTSHCLQPVKAGKTGNGHIWTGIRYDNPSDTFEKTYPDGSRSA